MEEEWLNGRRKMVEVYECLSEEERAKKDGGSVRMSVIKRMGREICKGDKRVKAVISHCQREE